MGHIGSVQLLVAAGASRVVSSLMSGLSGASAETYTYAVDLEAQAGVERKVGERVDLVGLGHYGASYAAYDAVGSRRFKTGGHACQATPP